MIWRQVWEIAGLIGMDPRPYTLREWFDMARGAWRPWSRLIRNVSEPHRDREQHPAPFTDCEFNPFDFEEPLETVGGSEGQPIAGNASRIGEVLHRRKLMRQGIPLDESPQPPRKTRVVF